MMRSTISWIGVLAAIGLFAAWLANATEPVKGPMRFADRGSHFTVNEPRFREIGKAGVSLVAAADSAHFDQLDGLVTVANVRGYMRDQGRQTQLFADAGTYSVNATTAVISGNVTIRNDEGYEFRTSEAVYKHHENLLYADGRFDAEGNGLQLNGIGLRYDLVADRFVVDRNVGAKIERFEF